MLIIQEQKKVALSNKRHFEERKNGECAACLKILYVNLLKKNKMGCLEGSDVPLLYIGRTVPTG
jgi:hypothetical protein